MKALLLKGPGEAVVTELEKPSISPEDVLIRSRAVGICGSDVELYQGIRPEGYYRYPVVPGHEWAGEVVAVGERVRGISPGDKVVAEGFLFCGTCRNCRMGLTVVVVGDGTIGLLAVQLARLFSPTAIALVGSRSERLELGHQLGATHTLNTRENDPQSLIHSLTGGRGADLVFEGGNRPEGVEQALSLVRRGGTVVLEGIAGSGARLSIESDIFVLKHLTVYGIFGASSAAWTYAVQIFRAGLLNLAPLITHRYALDEYQTALDTLISRQSKMLKVLVVHNGDQEGRER